MFEKFLYVEKKLGRLCYLAAIALCMMGCGKQEKALMPAENTQQAADVSTEVSQQKEQAVDQALARELYMSFLKGETGALTAESYALDDEEYNEDGLYYGTYTIGELVECREELETSRILISYGFCDFGADGTEEMVVCMENTQQTMLRWTGIFSVGPDSTLYLASSHTDGYRTSAYLYDNGYWISGGSGGATFYQTDVFHISEKGEKELCFSLMDLWGYSVSELMYALTGEIYEKDGITEAPIDESLCVKAHVEKGKVQYCVVERSQDPLVRQSEDALFETLKSHGAVEISKEEMEPLQDLADYQGNLVQLDAYGALWKENYSMLSEDVHVDYATQEFLANKEAYDLYVIDDSEYSVFLVFEAWEDLSNVAFYNISLQEVGADGQAIFEASKLFDLPSMSPGKSVVVQTSFPGDTPNLGITFTNAGGESVNYSVSMSGYDGSIVLAEESPFSYLQ